MANSAKRRALTMCVIGLPGRFKEGLCGLNENDESRKCEPPRRNFKNSENPLAVRIMSYACQASEKGLNRSESCCGKRVYIDLPHISILLR